MGWAKGYIDRLKNGETVTFRPKGNSMTPKIKSGELCTVEPIKHKIEIGDVVLCVVKGNDYLHLVKSKSADGRYQIGNNKGGINGWISKESVFGKLIDVSS